ncbi:DUF3422 family protein [Amaricoccus tamworthensis]|uniref:DUF3422 family protein n=1 Tax=Amaricoccus tamworthensis TaxID=57002 RepID=UPI003C7ACB83
MTLKTLPDYPDRYALSNELHARPFPVLDAPCNAVFLAIKQPKNAAERDRSVDIAHLIELLDRYGSPHPPPGASHYSGAVGRGFLKWEMHTEVVTYTFYTGDRVGEPFSSDLFKLFPADWLAKAPGNAVTTSIVRIETVAPDDRARVMEEKFPTWFVAESLAASRVTEDHAIIAGDFRIDENGHSRFAVLANPEISSARLGRITQRVLEVELYKSLSMLTLPEARKVASTLDRLDRELSSNALGLEQSHGQEREDLDRLLKISAEIEQLSTNTAFRFGAFEAYSAIVGQRIEALREQRVGDSQLFSEFMMRRFDPAMRTCRSARKRLEDLSSRASRAANLLRTRVDVANQEYNNETLRQMDNRAAMQLRLQKTVEGLSVVAISYYAVNLLAGLLGPVGKTLGLDKVTLVAILTIPVIVMVWKTVHRIREKLEGDDAP